jgi:hypothetical protein
VKPGTEVRWSGVWASAKASAERRLGKPLLKTYLLLAVFGAVTVAVSIIVMYLEAAPAEASALLFELESRTEATVQLYEHQGRASPFA